MSTSTQTALGLKLTDATRRAFKAGYTMVPTTARQMFNVQSTEKKVEVFNSAIMDQFASDTGDGENYAAFNPTLGDELTLTQYKVTASFEVTEDAQQYDQYGMLDAIAGAKALGDNVAKRMELDIQQLISHGASTSYTNKDGNTVSTLSADGLALFHSAHTVNGSASTYDNVDATAFGQTGLETLEGLFRNFLNQDGQIIDKVPTAIFSTTKPALVNLIREYNKSMGHPEDAFNGVNVYMQRYNHISLDFLDCDSAGARDAAKDDYWGLVVMKDPNLKCRVSQNPTIHGEQLVQRNRNKLYQASAKYAIGVEDPNCIALSAA